MLVGFQERLLQYVFGILLILCDVSGQPKDPTFVTIYKLAEGGGLARLGPGYQGGLIRLRQRCGDLRHSKPDSAPIMPSPPPHDNFPGVLGRFLCLA